MKSIIMFFLAIIACASLLHGSEDGIVDDLTDRIENASKQYESKFDLSSYRERELSEGVKKATGLLLYQATGRAYSDLIFFINAPCFDGINSKYRIKGTQIDINKLSIELNRWNKIPLTKIGDKINEIEESGYHPKTLNSSIDEIAIYVHFIDQTHKAYLLYKRIFDSFPQEVIESNMSSVSPEYYRQFKEWIEDFPDKLKIASECIDILILRIKPFFDQEIALLNQEKSRQNDFRSHVKAIFKESGIPSDFYWDGEYAISALESPVFNDGEIFFMLKLFVLPRQTASISAFHPYVNDEHLGSPKLAELYAFNNGNPERKIYKQGESVSGPNEVAYVFAYDLNDASEARTARIVVSGKNVRFEKNIPISEMPSDRPSLESALSLNMPMKMEGTRIIRGKKENNHLLIPTVIQRDGNKVNIPLLLDTGASITVIPLNAYSRISETNQDKLRKIPIQTANGGIEVPIDMLVVNTEAYSKKMNVALSEDDVCLLGVDYFEGYIYTVDVENECLYLTKNR